MARLFRGGTYYQSRNAFGALRSAASDFGDDGVPYARALDIFVRIYESYEDRTHPTADKALSGIFQTGGADYVRHVFETSEKPPECERPPTIVGFPEPENPCPNVATWCDAGWLLMHFLNEGPHPDEYYPLCRLSRKAADGTWRLLAH